MSHLTPAAKSKLSSTVRELRDRLLTDLQNAVESAYLLAIPAGKAKLREAERTKRWHLEAYLDEQERGEKPGQAGKQAAVRQRHLQAAIKQAATTLLNRLVVIKQMEAMGLIHPKVVTGGWSSAGYREWREFAPELCRGDESEGFGSLLGLLYDELALELPGLFGPVGVAGLIPVPAATLRAVVEALDVPELVGAWLDDTTLGWVYQFWNDPEREALDAKLNSGGKVEPHEIASKTQMFTERYMVEWLLHNSLGQQWLGICDRNGWIAEVQADGTLDRLEERRSQWRSKREAGVVALDALMPIKTEMEERWKYWVRQPLVESQDLASIRDIKILDPACGSGHFLVIAMGLLFELYREEAQHRKGEANYREDEWTDRAIVESIIENNLYGIDIDPRVVQTAAAALFLKGKGLCKEASPKRLNLVPTDLQIMLCEKNDPAVVNLCSSVMAATGIPAHLTNRIVDAFKTADQWGTLLKIDREVEGVIAEYERSLATPVQLDAFTPPLPLPLPLSASTRKDLLLDKLEYFLASRMRGDDLGLWRWGKQLESGVLFIRLLREGMYDLVVGNPPYLGASKMADAQLLAAQYPKGKADLYAAFLERGFQLAKPGGIVALLTKRNWMFIQQFSALREYLLENFDLRVLGDVDRGAFEEIVDEVVSTTMSIFQNAKPNNKSSIAIQPTPLDDNARDSQRTNRKRAAILAQVGRFEFKSDRFDRMENKPLVYWWNDSLINDYSSSKKLIDIGVCREGLGSRNDPRYIRFWWEVQRSDFVALKYPTHPPSMANRWMPFIKGAKGKVWQEPLEHIISWEYAGAHIATYEKSRFGRGANEYFKQGIAISTMGNDFNARIHRFSSIFGDAGVSAFSENIFNLLCCMNSRKGRLIVESLNPSTSFKVNDIKRFPTFLIESATEIFAQLDQAFTQHEAARETSVEFQHPGPSCWAYAQAWAQQAVDRPAGAPLPDWHPTYADATPEDWLSYSIGIALGRFGREAAEIAPSSPSPFSPMEKGNQTTFAPLSLGKNPSIGEQGNPTTPAPLSLGRGAGGEGLSELAGRNRQISPVLLERARELRKAQTPAEQILWECLRNRQLHNAKFRRQHNIDQIIADFYCHEAHLIIELDGGIHRQRQTEDRIRDDWATTHSFTVLRITNDQILNHLEPTLTQILQHLQIAALTPQPPLPVGEEEQEMASLPSPPGRGAGGEGLLPHGILYLSAYNPDTDSLSHPAAKPIQQTWEQSGSAIAKGKPLHHWLRHNFFKDTHLKRYDQRPIYFPLSSVKLNFVAHISIHRWHATTLPTLLADHLVPDLTQLDGELADLIETRLQADRKTQNQADDRYSTLLQLRDELKAFIALVRQCADQGPPPASPKDIPRETDARFVMDLDDGVMINSAALWPLLEPQWKKPKTWWSELCNAQGKKDYDWAHLAARYFPDRVATKCQTDPSLAVAHGCFWRYHPAKAYEWELRLQDEIVPDFTIDEADSDHHRQTFTAHHPSTILELKEKEEKRRDRKRKKATADEDSDDNDLGPLFSTESED